MDLYPPITDLISLRLPIYIGEALEYFFNNAHINVYSEDKAINLMDLFPLCKQGYVLRETLSNLMYTYINFNMLSASPQYIKSDDLMYQAFGGIIPAMFYTYRDPITHKMIKVTMEEAIDTGLISDYMNTYQVIKQLFPNFDPTNFEKFLTLNINAVNYMPIKSVPGAEEIILDKEFIDGLVKEYYLARDIHKIYPLIIDSLAAKPIPNGAVNVYVMMDKALVEGHTLLFNALAEHPDINKLYVSIIMGDADQVRQYLNYYDPRNDKHKAYFMAVEVGDQQIIDMIKESIIQRNLLEQEAVKTRIGELVGETDLPQTIHTYARRAFQ